MDKPQKKRKKPSVFQNLRRIRSEEKAKRQFWANVLFNSKNTPPPAEELKVEDIPLPTDPPKKML